MMTIDVQKTNPFVAEALRLEEMEMATTFKDQSPILPVDRNQTLPERVTNLTIPTGIPCRETTPQKEEKITETETTIINPQEEDKSHTLPLHAGTTITGETKRRSISGQTTPGQLQSFQHRRYTTI